MQKVEFRDKYLNEEHKILHTFDAMNAHTHLTQLILTNCGLSDDSLDMMLFKLVQYPNQIWHLDVSQNDLTFHSMPSICQYMKHENGWKLRSIILNRNTLYDNGL